MKRMILIPVVASFLILGAGCEPPPPPEVPEPEPPPEVGFEKKTLVPAETQTQIPLCLKLSDPRGFQAWAAAYAEGDENATSLAVSIGMPEEADPKLIANIRATHAEDLFTRFFCVLNHDQDAYVWVSDVQVPESEPCVSKIVTSVGSTVTTSEVETQGTPETCEDLCEPMVETDTLFIWECDKRWKDGFTEWSELRMNRETGKAEVVGCIEDESGVTEGCVK